MKPVKLENRPFHEAWGHPDGTYLGFNVFLVKPIALLYFAHAKGVYHLFMGFLSAATWTDFRACD